MEAFNQQKAIERYAQLMTIIASGAYDEREIDGSYGEDGVELAVANLVHQVEQARLQFCQDGATWKLQPFTEQEKMERREVLLSGISNMAKEKVEHDLHFFKAEETRIYELLPGGGKWYVEVFVRHIDDIDDGVGQGITMLCRVAYDSGIGFLRAKRINSIDV